MSDKTPVMRMRCVVLAEASGHPCERVQAVQHGRRLRRRAAGDASCGVVAAASARVGRALADEAPPRTAPGRPLRRIYERARQAPQAHAAV